jgi:uncharacterized membrane protein
MTKHRGARKAATPARPKRSLPRVVGHVARVRPILLGAAVTGAAILAALPAHVILAQRLLLAWDAFTIVYMVFASAMIARSGPDDIQRRAEELDEGRALILFVTITGSVASLGAIVAQLAQAQSGGQTHVSPIVLSVATVMLSWTFTHVIFALHYAHEYYGPQDDADGVRQGLKIPGEEEPTYLDFLYFSFVIGCACATADIDVTSRPMRRIALVHGIVAFAFNAAILALSINIAAGLLAR